MSQSYIYDITTTHFFLENIVLANLCKKINKYFSNFKMGGYGDGQAIPLVSLTFHGSWLSLYG